MSSVYIIVPSVVLTMKMVNRSINRTVENTRPNNDNTSYLLEVGLEGIDPIFDQFRWYNSEEIRVELAKPEWNPPDVPAWPF